MNRWVRRLLLVFGGLLLIMLIGVALGVLWRDFLINLWWFDSLGYGLYFWQRHLYRYAVFVAVTLGFFGLFFLNFWIASRFLRASKLAGPKKDTTRRRHFRELVWKFRRGSLYLYLPLSLALAILIAMPLFRSWQEFLFYVFGPSSGIADPVYGKDISYYLFSFPIYLLIQSRLVIASIALACGLAIMYWFERRLLAEEGKKLWPGAKWHLSAIILLVFVLEIWGYILQRYELLYRPDHLPRFFGPGFVDMHYVLPLIWLSLISLAGVAVSLIIFIHRRKGAVVICAFGLLFVVFTLGRHSSAITGLMDRYLVAPNEMSREWKYMDHNIKATLAAYKLLNVETRDFKSQRTAQVTIPHVQTLLNNVPVWDSEQLQKVYRQLQELRTYYLFNQVSVGRYMVEGDVKQVFLAARELDYRRLPGQGRNWINQHLSYTHGYGAVMTPASQMGGAPMTWFLSDVPPHSDYGFTIEQPGIYYGLGNYHYVIAPNSAREINYPEGNDNVLADYGGKGGVSLSSYWHKMMFAFYFSDRNILFTTKTKAESRILFRRNLLERIQAVTPYLMLDRSPYLVVTPKRLFWIQDAYTRSLWYPYAMPCALHNEQLNYLRNSVKIVMDAYDGSLDFYISDPEDPIIEAYSRMYPGVFKPLSKMPADLRPHIRYPQDLFETQMNIYAKYHQTDPGVFYQEEDIWEVANTPGVQEDLSKTAHYATLDLIQPDHLDFLLLMPMLPLHRNNLRALTVVGCDGDNYGRIVIYNFPKGESIFGPAQMDALINQDTDIAKDFTLWDQSGSNVVRGHMIVLPVGNAVFYIQPIYLEATSMKIPELQRVIMARGQEVVMATSLEEAYARLTRMDATTNADEGRAPVTPPPKPEPSNADQLSATPPNADRQPGVEQPKADEPPKPETEPQAQPEESPKASPTRPGE